MKYFCYISKWWLGFFIFCTVTTPCALGEIAHSYNQQGIEYMKSREYEKAAEAFKEALKNMPNSISIKRNLAYAYMGVASSYYNKKDFEKALLFAKKAYNLIPNDGVLSKQVSFIYLSYALQQMHEGHLKKAYNNFKEVLKYDRNNHLAYIYLGRILYDTGDIKGAEEMWDKAYKINPSLKGIKQTMDKIEKEKSVGKNFKSKKYRYFEVKYEGRKRENLAEEALDILEDAYYEIGNKFRYRPKSKVVVIIYTKEQFKSVTGRPDWVAGTFDGIIRIRASDILRKKELKQILYHEYTHALLYNKVGNNIPVWLNEGLAKYMEPPFGTVSREEVSLLRRSLKEKIIIPLSRISSVFSRKSTEKIKLAYLESKLIAIYLDKRYHFYRIRDILDRLSKGDSINEALKKILNLDVDTLEKKWFKWLKNTYY